MRLELEKITFCWDFLTRVIVRAVTGASSLAVLFLSLPELQWVVGLTQDTLRLILHILPALKYLSPGIFIMLFFVFFCLFLFQFKKSPPKIPYKAIALATVLFLIGAFLIIIGSLLLAGYVSKGGADGPVPLVIIGILVFLQILPPVHRLLCIQRLPGILLWWHSRVSWLAPTPALRKESQMELSPALNIEQKLWLRAKDFCSLQMFNQTVAKLYGSVLKDVN